jgi:hypothetical protein
VEGARAPGKVDEPSEFLKGNGGCLGTVAYNRFAARQQMHHGVARSWLPSPWGLKDDQRGLTFKSVATATFPRR